MAVPKKKTSKSRKGMRRSHHNHKPINVIVNKNGVPHLPGHIASDKIYGETYGEKVIIAPKEAVKEEKAS